MCRLALVQWRLRQAASTLASRSAVKHTPTHTGSCAAWHHASVLIKVSRHGRHVRPVACAWAMGLRCTADASVGNHGQVAPRGHALILQKGFVDPHQVGAGLKHVARCLQKLFDGQRATWPVDVVHTGIGALCSQQRPSPPREEARVVVRAHDQAGGVRSNRVHKIQLVRLAATAPSHRRGRRWR